MTRLGYLQLSPPKNDEAPAPEAKPKRGNRVGQKIDCPHCGTPVSTYISNTISPTIRRWEATCPNTECGAIFGGSTAIEGEYRPSLKPNPAIVLPVLNRRAYNRRAETAAPETPPCPSK